MAGLQRYDQKEFGVNAGANQMAKYGTATTTKETYDGSITPDIIQENLAFLEGLYAALGGAYSPTIQDQNSLFRLSFRQIKYLLERGIPEWSPGTTYNLNDFCKVGNVIYYSLIDTNLNIPPASDITKWHNTMPIPINTQIFLGPTSGTYTPTSTIRKPLFVRVRLCGAGGGGAGGYNSTDGPSASNGGNGGNSTFGSWVCNGGEGGKTTRNGSLGGDVIFSGSGIGRRGQCGGSGLFLSHDIPSSTIDFRVYSGGTGGQSLFNGAGANSQPDATEYTGCGGAGGGFIGSVSSGDEVSSGDGGGGGAYIDAILKGNDLSIPYSWSLEDGGSAGNGSNVSNYGGKGSKPILIIDEYF